MSRTLATAALALVAALSASSAMAQSYTAPAGISPQTATVAPAPRSSTVVVPGSYDSLTTGSVVRSRQGHAVRR